MVKALALKKIVLLFSIFLALSSGVFADGSGSLSVERSGDVAFSGNLNGFAFTDFGEYAVDNGGTAYELIEDSEDSWSTGTTYSITGNTEGLTYSEDTGHFYVTDGNGDITEYDSNWNLVDSFSLSGSQIDGIDYSERHNEFTVSFGTGSDMHRYDTNWNDLGSSGSTSSDAVAAVYFDSIYPIEYTWGESPAWYELDRSMNQLQQGSWSSTKDDDIRGTDIDVYGTGDLYLVGENGAVQAVGFSDGAATLGSPPQINSGPDFTDSTNSHSFDVSLTASDPDGDSDISSCDMVVDDNEGNSKSYNMNIDRGYGGSGDVECYYNAVSSSDRGGWSDTENVDVTVTVTDSDSKTDTSTSSHSFPNHAPDSPQGESPTDTASSVLDNTLSVDVSDPDGDNLDVTFYGREQGSSSWANLGTDTGVADGSTASINWDRNGQSNMYDFDRGGSYEWAVEIDDGNSITDNLGSPYGFSVLNEATLSSPTPTGGDNSNYLNVTIDNPSNRDTDVEFWIRDGGDEFKHATDTVTGGSGTASVSVENFELQNVDTGEWYVKLDDGKSKVDYSTSLYGNKDYDFVTARPPNVKPDAADSYPVNTSSVGLDPDLQIYVEDPDNSDMNVTFFQGSPGSNQLGDPVAVNGGDGYAVLDTDGMSFGSQTGTRYEWSVQVEDLKYDEIAESNNTYWFDTVENPVIDFVSPTAGENDVNVEPGLESEITQGDNEDVQVEYSVDGGGLNLSHQEIASGTASGSMVSQSFELEEGTQYDWVVNASFNDEYGNVINASDSISFTVADTPSLIDSYPDSESGLVNPELNVSFDNGNDPVRVEFYDWENEALLESASGVSGSYSYDTSNSGSFGGEAGQTYFWYVVVEDEATGATYNSSEALGNPWEFSTSDVLDANVNIVQGDRNLNPGSANFGPSEIKVQIGNSKDLDMGEARFYIEGSRFKSISPAPVDETISADITDDVAAEDSQFDWSVEVLEDGNEIENYSGTFTTHVVSLDWVDKSSEDIPARFNLYHSDEDTAFKYGDDDYRFIGNTEETSVSVALPNLGYGSDDCFRVTA